MQYEKLHKNSIKSWFFARIIGTIIISVILLTARYFLIKNNFELLTFKGVKLGIEIFIGTVIFLSLLEAIIYPIFEFKQWSYLIDEDKIEFQEGIFFRKTVLIPIVRIQHIEFKQGPINRFLKLADVEINTAGGTHKIPNIELCRAEEISRYLNNKVKEKVEEEKSGQDLEVDEKILSEKEEDNV